MTSFKIALVVLTAALLAGCNSSSTSAPSANNGAADSRVATAKPGWLEVKTSGIALSFPSDWQAIDVSGHDAMLKSSNSFGSDPQSKDLEVQAEQMAKQGIFKLFVIAPRIKGASLPTNCSVIVNDLPRDVTLEQLVQLNADQLKTLSVDGKVDTAYLDTPGGKVGKITAKVKAQTAGGANSILYIALKARKIAVVTFTSSNAGKAEVEGIADQTIKSFRFE